jgi:uncharacterized membrane protein
VYQLSVYLHLVSAIIWIGGMYFLALVVLPTTRHLPAPKRAARLGSPGRRFRTVGWICIGLLVQTCTLNSGHRGLTWEGVLSGQLLANRFGLLLGLKLLAVLAIVALSVIHDSFVGPASVEALEHPEQVMPEETAALRRQASWQGRLNALLRCWWCYLAWGQCAAYRGDSTSLLCSAGSVAGASCADRSSEIGRCTVKALPTPG